MSMDPISEKISHFIGSFEMLSEQMRMREVYEEFRAMVSAQAQADMLELMSYGRKHDYDLEGYDPNLKLKLVAKLSASLPSSPDPFLVPTDVLQPSVPFAADTPYIAPELPEAGAGLVNANFVLPIPSEVITVTLQTITLSDNDIFGQIDAAAFEELVPLKVILKQLEIIAETLGVISFGSISLDGDWVTVISDIQSNAFDALQNDAPQLEVAVFQGDLPEGPIVNGEVVDEMPEWEDIIPAYHFAKLELEEDEPEEEEQAGTKQPVEHDFSRDFDDYEESPFAVDPGKEIVAGANKLINTTSIYSNWLDASVFVVGGDVLQFDAISQINVLVDHDVNSGVDAFTPVAAAPSTTLNAAEIETLTVAEADEEALQETQEKEDDEDTPVVVDEDDPVEAQPQETLNESEPPAEAPSGAPANWAITHYNGDLVQFNLVKQYTFSTDMDQAAFSVGAASTFLGLGENQFLNSFNTQQIGFEFDLIFVAGDMVDVNLVEQTNVIFDSDKVIGSGDALGKGGSLDTVGDQQVTDDITTVALPAQEVGITSQEIVVEAQPLEEAQSAADTPESQTNVPAPEVAQVAKQSEETQSKAQVAVTIAAPLAVSEVQQTSVEKSDSSEQVSEPAEDEPEIIALAVPAQEPVSDVQEDLTQLALALTETDAPDDIQDSSEDVVQSVGSSAPGGIAVGQQAGGPQQNAPGQIAKMADDAPSSDDVGPKENGNGPPSHANNENSATQGVSQGDNLLFNKGQIKKIGKDTDTELTEHFAEGVASLADTEEDVSDDIVQDALFDGMELLRVLYIDGDFTTANLVEQTNVLGDSDQVQIAHDDFAAALQEQITVTTGANIAANFAAITDQGVDSVIMAQGDTYSDALIHQANLVDSSNGKGKGLGKADLANEAVAFLAEGLVDPDLSAQIAEQANAIVAEAFQHADGTDAVLT